MTQANTEYYDSIPRWSVSKKAVCDRVIRSRGPLKIILKTKDETLLLRRWIEYYSVMVGIDNLVVFDNGSTSETVKGIYAYYGERLNVVRFDTFVDSVHDANIFPEFYEALRASSKYFSLIDTDEFLIWVAEDGTYISDARVVKMITTTSDPTIYPALWLSNLPAYTNRVWFPTNDFPYLVNALKWGKPVVNSALKLPKRILHNIELIDSSTLENIPAIRTNCFLLHLNRLSPSQRVATNLNKLRAHGVLQRHEGLGEALQLNAEQMRGSLKAVVDQIKSLSNAIEEPIDVDRPLVANAIELSKNGIISSFDDDQLLAIRRYVTDHSAFLNSAFGITSTTC